MTTLRKVKIIPNPTGFIKIFKKGNSLERADLKNFKEKYYQLYISEADRDAYSKSLASIVGKEDAKEC